jgi:hypothetical protein
MSRIFKYSAHFFILSKITLLHSYEFIQLATTGLATLPLFS